jgi:hypothetical protein
MIGPQELEQDLDATARLGEAHDLALLTNEQTAEHPNALSRKGEWVDGLQDTVWSERTEFGDDLGFDIDSLARLADEVEHTAGVADRPA